MERYVIGADEVGRGCLAGPLCVGAVLVPVDMARPAGVDDSKKLTAAKREEVTTRLAGITRSLVFIEAAEIDRRGMSACLRKGFQEAVGNLLMKRPTGQITKVVIDGTPIAVDAMGVPIEFLVKGDSLDWRVGAASILAKVARDDLMVKAAAQFPAYAWEDNKGYGSAAHQKAIEKHGLTPLHRATFCRRWTTPTAPVEDEEDLSELLAMLK